MELPVKHIPKEYLALKINYCRQQIKKLPELRLQKTVESGKVRIRISGGGHRFFLGTESGNEYYSQWLMRDQFERELQAYETIWICNYRGDPSSELTPHKVIRSLCVDTNSRIVMDKKFFDSLKNDADTKHPKPTDYPFNGIYYRSAAERDIAMFYTEMGIPFKYEPEITIKGLPGPIYPDFVIYIRELDNCKIHEHFGIKNSSNYLRITGIKYNNYTNAGLVPEMDIIFTHNVEEIPFDIRGLSSKLNTAVYITAVSTEHLSAG